MNNIKYKSWLQALVIVAGLFNLTAKAQSFTGNACSNAITATDNTNYQQERGEGWLKFTATGLNQSLSITRVNSTDPIAINKLTVYSGACTGLTPLGSDVLSSSTDQQLNVSLSGLTNGQTYFIKTDKLNLSTNCTDCAGEIAVFNVGLTRVEPCGIKWTLYSESYPYYITNTASAVPPILATGSSTGTSAPDTVAFLPPVCGNTFINFLFTFSGGSSAPITLFVNTGFTTYVTTGSTSASYVFQVPANTTTNVLTYTILINPVSTTLFSYGCKRIIFDVYPNPNTNFTVVPNPVCKGNLFCINTPAQTGTLSPIINYYQGATAIGLNPNFALGIIPYYTNPNFIPPSSGFLNNFLLASNPPPTACFPTSSYTVSQLPLGMAAYYNFPAFPNYRGCLKTDTTILVIAPPAGTISITSPTTSICKGSSMTLTANVNPNIVSYTWQPMNTNGITAVVTPTATTTYTLFASTAAGCVTSAVITIEAQDCCLPTLPGLKTLVNCTVVANGSGGSTPFASVTSATNALIAAPVGGVLTGTLFIKGNLTISAAVSIVSSRVIFDEAAGMIQNSNLTINKSYLSGCNKNWKGINTIAVLTVSNSVIEDAESALYTGGTGTLITHSGIFLYNTIFNKNLIGVNLIFKQVSSFVVRECLFTNRALNYATLYLTGNLWRNFTAFTPSSLNATPNANLLGSTVLGLSNQKRGQIGIQFAATKTSPSALTVGANIAQASYVNLFDNMPVGIYANDAKVNVIKNMFINISGTSGYDAYANQTSGVYITNSQVLVGTSTGSIGSVASNSFITGGTGVMATANSSVTIGANQFNGLNYGVFFTKLYNNATNSFVNTIVNNSFLNNNIDIDCFDNQKNSTSIISNTSNHTPNAFKSNAAYNVVLAELSSNQNCVYKVESNNFTGKFTYGVYAVQVYGASVANNTITMKPPFGSNFMGNIWIENSSQMIVKYNTLDVSPSASWNWNTFGIFTSLSTNNLYCNNDIKRAGVSMKFQGTSPSKIYANKLNNLPSDPNQVGLFLDNNASVGNINIPVAANFIACAENEFGDFGFADTYAFNGSQGSQIDYNGAALASNPFYPAVNEPVLSPQAFAPVSNNNTGYVDCGAPTAQQQQRLSTGIAPVINNQVNLGANTQTALHIADKGIYEVMRKSNVNAANVNGGTNFMSTMATTNIGKFNKVDSLTSRFAVNQSTATLQQAINLNVTAATNNAIDQNQKTFNGIYHTYLKGLANVTTMQWNSLKALAALCPFTDGTSVYQARTFLANTGDTTHYANACEVFTPPVANSNRLMNNSVTGSIETNVLALNTAVFPNPASSELTITTDLIDADLTVMNVLGEVLIKTQLNPVTKLDVSNLKNGTYLYTISKDKAIIKSDKLIITK